MKIALLREVIGPRAAGRLIQRFGGKRVYVPKFDHANRDEAIFESRNESISVIVKRFNLSKRRIHEVIMEKLNPHMR